MFECFRSQDLEEEYPFAVKISRENDEEKQMAHRKEFDLTKELDHKNIISSIDIFENWFTGEIHQVMPLIKGKELIELISNQRFEEE